MGLVVPGPREGQRFLYLLTGRKLGMCGHSGLQGQAIRGAKGKGRREAVQLAYNMFSIPDSSYCAELREQRSPRSPSVTGTAPHFPHLCGPGLGLWR